MHSQNFLRLFVPVLSLPPEVGLFFFPVLFLSNLGAVYPMQWQQKKRVNTFLLEGILKKIGITLLSVFSSLHILYYFTIL